MWKKTIDRKGNECLADFEDVVSAFKNVKRYASISDTEVDMNASDKAMKYIGQLDGAGKSELFDQLEDYVNCFCYYDIIK